MSDGSSSTTFSKQRNGVVDAFLPTVRSNARADFVETSLMEEGDHEAEVRRSRVNLRESPFGLPPSVKQHPGRVSSRFQSSADASVVPSAPHAAAQGLSRTARTRIDCVLKADSAKPTPTALDGDNPFTMARPSLLGGVVLVQ